MLFEKKNQVITALVTPFLKNHEIDFDSLTHLIEYQIDQGIDGLVVLGTTAESVTMSILEKKQVLQHALKIINNRVPVIIGVGSNCTKTTIDNHKDAKNYGVQASLIVTPYYNNPSSEDIYYHFKTINDAVDFPFILYHVPSRTNSKLNINDAKRILDLENCIGIKDATASNSWMSLIGTPNKIMYSGDDATAFDYCSAGGQGVISVMSNLSPSAMHNLLTSNNNKYLDLCRSLSCETNPIPIKWLLKQSNIIQNDNVRMPLRPLQKQFQEKLLKAYVSSK